MLRDGRDVTGLELHDWSTDPRTSLVAARAGVTLPPLEHRADADPLPAFVNWGRWLVWCPDCPGRAEDVWRACPQMFCLTCGNAAVGGRWRSVHLPSPETIAEIEAALGVLPVAHQNWDPAAGIGLPDDEEG